MYLKSLTLKGFKSFADKTSLVFDPGLTVVVGPNGSGKSNVSDAILWVLGEQSAKMLRGQAMEDVIFSGSSGRSAVGLAEVTLVLDNADHVLPIDFSEVAITRRMYRSGESEYLINGAPARLRDITDILHDTGLGRETHSIISQGKLDSILQSRPEERRELVEEAAGISKHRRRLERSQRKMEAMRGNLARAKDVEREINRQLKPLERQVDKARQHRDATQRLQELEATLAVDDLRQLQEAYEALTGQGREAAAAVELAQYRLDGKKSELERYQSLLEQKGIFVGDLGEQRRRMQDLLGRMDSDMRLLEEKGKNMVARLSEMRASLSLMDRQEKEATEERDQVSAQLAEARGSVDELSRTVGELRPAAKEAAERRRRLGAEQGRLSGEARSAQRTADEETLAYARLSEQIGASKVEDEMYAGRLAQIEDSLATANEALEAQRKASEEASSALAQARGRQEGCQERIRAGKDALARARKAEQASRERLSGAKATLSALSSVDRQSENASALVAALAKGAGQGVVRCRVADVLEAPEELEGLVEALLGEDLGGLVVEGPKDVAALAEGALASKAKGRAAIVALEGARQAAPAPEAPGEPLLARLTVHGGAEALVSALLGDVRLVGSVAEAVGAHATAPGLTYVSADGVAVLPDGRCVVGMSAGAEEGALERKRRIRALEGGMGALETQLDQAHRAASEAEAALTAAREELASAKGEVARLQAQVSAATSERGRLEGQVRQATSERAQVERKRREAADRAAKARDEVERHHRAAKEAEARAKELQERLEEVQRDRQQASHEESDAEGRLSDAKLRLATVTERRNHLAVREEELSRRARQLHDRRQATEESVRALDVVRLRVKPLHDRYDAVHERALSWAARLKDRASLAEADSDSLKRTIAEARDAVDAASEALEAARASANDVKVRLGRVEVQVENAINAITSTGMELDDALRLPEPDDRDEMERQVERLRGRIESIGPVNEVAMDEYERLKARSDYVGRQVADLEEAEKALRKVSQAIERKMRRQFAVVFERVNVNFKDIFSLLFPGGLAHLELTDPDHLESTGVEIVAQPRGKRIQKMSLMSGGEKSLTALALLFAVYRTRTVPFYVFDEVEAALDDSNLSKLLDAIEQLKESTQLIVISHQRRTMEQADVLYGVSMQADGVSHVVSQRLDRTTGRVVQA